ncbi:hypothetical protein [Shewanella atlantica]|uniref:hypothetical protein n=1 Tax=Shewanella atlantica TaxID=271099 RepID=UPI00163ABFB3|nr:hypothetical protein [Shewanella atlantica]
MSVLTPEHLIESAKNHLKYAKYWRGVGDTARYKELIQTAKELREQAAEMVRGL